MHALLHGHIDEAVAYNALTMPVATLLAVELCYRIYASSTLLPDRHTALLARWDRRLHIALLAGYTVYSAWFYAR